MIATRGARGGFILQRTHSGSCWCQARLTARYPLAHKTKKFPCLHIFGGGVRGGADKRLKGYFFVFGSPLRPPKSSVLVSIYLRAFHFTFLRTRGV